MIIINFYYFFPNSLPVVTLALEEVLMISLEEAALTDRILMLTITWPTGRPLPSTPRVGSGNHFTITITRPLPLPRPLNAPTRTSSVRLTPTCRTHSATRPVTMATPEPVTTTTGTVPRATPITTGPLPLPSLPPATTSRTRTSRVGVNQYHCDKS